MLQSGKPIIRLVPAALVFAAGFVLAGLFDLPLNIALYAPTNDWAVFMEVFGWYPAFLPPILLCLSWFTAPAGALRRTWLRWAGGALAAAGFAILYSMSAHYMQRRHWLPDAFGPMAALWLAMGVLFAALCVFLMWRPGQNLRSKLQFFLFWASAHTLLGQAVVQPLKILWQRTRFDDMAAAGSFEAFTPWWQPLGSGGSSFPSGHTSQAASVLALLILCDLFAAWHRRRKWVCAAGWAYVAFMAFCRILVGRHFFSDTLAAAAILALLLFALRQSSAYRRGLARLSELPIAPKQTRPPPGGGPGTQKQTLENEGTENGF